MGFGVVSKVFNCNVKNISNDRKRYNTKTCSIDCIANHFKVAQIIL